MNLIDIITAMDASSFKRRRAYFPEKVCFVVLYGSHYYFFIRDLSKGGNLNVESLLPLVRLESAETLSICGIDSTVFMVEHIRHEGIIQPAYCLDLDPNKHKSLNLKCGDLRKLPAMAGEKNKAVITRVPNSKRLLVFSSLLSVAWCFTRNVNNEYALDDPRGGVPVDFEMYDVDTESWVSLPRLCLRIAFRKRCSNGVVQLYDPVARYWKRVMRLTEENRGVLSVHISCFTFINDTTFVVKTGLGFMLRLDLASLGEGWKVYEEGRVASDDKVYVISGTSHGVTWCATASDVKVGMDMDMDMDMDMELLPLSSFDVSTTEKPGFRVGRLERKGYVCALQTALRKRNGYLQMVIDVVDVGGGDDGVKVKRVASFRSEFREDNYPAFPIYIFQYQLPTSSSASTPGSARLPT